MSGFTVKALSETTWLDFARLVERHNGVWGGCWCMAFHAEGVGRKKTPAGWLREPYARRSNIDIVSITTHSS